MSEALVGIGMEGYVTEGMAHFPRPGRQQHELWLKWIALYGLERVRRLTVRDTVNIKFCCLLCSSKLSLPNLVLSVFLVRSLMVLGEVED